MGIPEFQDLGIAEEVKKEIESYGRKAITVTAGQYTVPVQ